VSPTNLGYRLDRLDAATGKASWPRSCLLNLARLDTTTWAIDGETFSFSHHQFLEVHSLADGRLLWERPLPEAAFWALRRVGDGLLAFPDVASRPLFRFLYPGGSLQWEREKPLDAPAGLPLMCFDIHTGELIQRMNFPAFPRAQVRPGTPGSLVVASSLTPASGAPPVRLGPRGGVISLVGDVWGLAPESGERGP
jgi:hypothetical protein